MAIDFVKGEKLRVLQVGAGAMGTRRIRGASQRTEVEIAVYDTRTDRAVGAASTFRIPSFSTWKSALAWRPDALMISTPPNQHTEFVQQALDLGIHHFCEANIWTDNWQAIQQRAEELKLICAPSCSFRFSPLISHLKHLINVRLGTLHGYQFMLTTFMPHWHVGEGPEYYARQRSTAAAREMVPFELLWINDVFGLPQAVQGAVNQRSTLVGETEKLEDSWNLQIDLECGAVGNLAVYMGSPSNRRFGCCVGNNGMIEFDVARGIVTCSLNNELESTRSFGALTDNVESFYKEETHAFIDAILGLGRWPMSYRSASVATATLAAAEVSAQSARKEKVDLEKQPAEFPDDYGVQPWADFALRQKARRSTESKTAAGI